MVKDGNGFKCFLNYRLNKNVFKFQFLGRVVLQDFTGVAALVDLAAMRDAVAKNGKNPKKIDAKCPADLVIDHCVSISIKH